MNEKDVRLTYRFLGHKNETELRLIDPAGKDQPLIFFVGNEDSFVEVCKAFDGKRNIYVGINERINHGTKCKDVISVNAFVFDIDSVHPKDLPASDIERQLTRKVVTNILRDLVARRRNAFLAMSGNGWQIWMKLDIPLTDDNKKKYEYMFKRIQKEYIKNYKSPDAIIDNIGDLPRVIKVIGTTSLKPECRPDRAFRESYWVREPVNVGPDRRWAERLENALADVHAEEIEETFIRAEPIKLIDVLRITYKLSEKYRKMFNGVYDKTRYKSRSEAEFSLLISLARTGLDRKTVYSAMTYSKIGKWNNSPDAYKNLSVSKAFSYVSEKDD